MATPRVFIARHGETEWSLSGQHTSYTDLPLTARGEKRILATAGALVGKDRLIDPNHILKIYISPRLRARRTFHLLMGSIFDEKSDRVVIDDRIQEWNYGDYEGLKTAQIRALRRERGLDYDADPANGKPEGHVWNIWSDGCENGESPQQITDRLDEMIAEIQNLQRTNQTKKRKDILVIAHGHILRSFAMRWARRDISTNPALLLEAGGIGVLSYEHNNIDEPAILLGGAFVVPESTEEEDSEEEDSK
ncbi:histidine phosphatase superfamily [Lipomyces oligophaga]|uniref:histidine phosphatase superfamily n=1 Tax=Lipomyces oligophaga TaxID=45792 RepID=UPI0034CD78D5